jgi:hypothetical protein
VNPFISIRQRRLIAQPDKTAPSRLPGAGSPLTEEQLKQHLEEVDARTQMRIWDAMNPKPKPQHINCDDFDPFTW